VSQVAFGLHLLAKGLAKSEPAVIKILQVHVAELDGYIENTTEDIVLAFSDIEERLFHLRLPLGNIPVFSDMLADEAFRQTVVRDHERILHIIQRTALAMDDHAKDIEKGLQSVRILRMYLLELRNEWSDQTGSLGAVYNAMAGNVDGWKREFKRLKRKAYKLARSLSMLYQVAFEIQRLVDIASADRIVNHRHQKHTQNNSNRLSTIMHSPLPQSPADPDSYTAKAQAVSIVAGFTPSTLVKTASRQESPVSIKPDSMLQRGHQQNPSLLSGNKKELGSRTDYDYTRPNTANMTPRRSVTAPVVSESQTKDTIRKERKGEQQRPKTSSSKVAERFAAPEKESNKPLARFSSKIDRFQKSTSKIFSVPAFSRRNTKRKAEPRIEPSQKESLKPMERSWIDFDTRDKQMSWSRQAGGQSDVHTLASRKDTAPEFPHLFSMSFLEDQSASDEEDLKSPEDEHMKDETGKENGHEHQITALPTMAGFKDKSSQNDDMAAEVASTYSAKNRRFRAKNLHVPPLPKPKFGKPPNSDNNHVIYQNRNWLRPKPSTVFSFISSKKGAEDASLNSPSLFRSRPGSGISETPSRPMSSQTNHIHGSTTPVPSFNSTWATPKDVSFRNVETPPVSPKAFSSSATASANMRPGTSQSSTRGSRIDSSLPSDDIPRRAPAANTHERRASSATRAKGNSDIRSASSLSMTTTLDKPQHGSLSLFPRTPTTPRVRKFVSMTSLREVTAAENLDDRPPRSQG
jgi:hypothetical protein